MLFEFLVRNTLKNNHIMLFDDFLDQLENLLWLLKSK